MWKFRIFVETELNQIRTLEFVSELKPEFGFGSFSYGRDENSKFPQYVGNK